MDDHKEPRALSQAQLKASGFDSSIYGRISEPGTFIGRLDMKVWGNKSNLISFFTLTDGSKISCNTYPSNDYSHADGLSIGSIVELEFAWSSRNNLGLIRVKPTEGES